MSSPPAHKALPAARKRKGSKASPYTTAVLPEVAFPDVPNPAKLSKTTRLPRAGSAAATHTAAAWGSAMGPAITLGKSVKAGRRSGSRASSRSSKARRPPRQAFGSTAGSMFDTAPPEECATMDPDVLETKKLTLPFLDRLEYVRLHLSKRQLPHDGGDDGGAAGAGAGAGAGPESTSARRASASSSGGAWAVPADGQVPPLPSLSTGRPGSVSLESVGDFESDFGAGPPLSPVVAGGPPSRVRVGSAERRRVTLASTFDDTMLRTLLDGGSLALGDTGKPVEELLAAPVVDHSLLRRRYPRFTALLDRFPGPPPEPRTRSLLWLTQLVEEIYDGRQAFEAVDTGAGRSSMVSGLDTLPPMLLQGLMADGVDLGTGGAATAALPRKDKASGSAEAPTVIPWAFPNYALSHICNMFGLKMVVQQTAWDVVYNLELYREQHPELETFAALLRELFDTDVLLFFLHARRAIQRVMGDNAKEQLIPEPKLARILRRLLLDETLVAYTYEMLHYNRLILEVPGRRFPAIYRHQFLDYIVDQFRRTPMTIVRRLRYGDDGRGARMMAELQKTQRMQKRRAALEVKLKETQIELATRRAKVAKLQADNEQSGGRSRAAVVLAKSEASVQEREVADYQRQLQEIVEAEEGTWANAMVKTDATQLAKGKARTQSFGGASKAAETDCLRYYLTVQHELDEHKLKLSSKTQTAADMWAARVHAAKLRAARLIQRAFRKRQAAKEAARKANAEMARLRQERKLRLEREEAERREAELAAQRAEEEQRAKLWIERKEQARQMMMILQGKLLNVCFRRWAIFREVNKRAKRIRRRELLMRFTEWKAACAHAFQARSVVVDIQRITRGYFVRKRVTKILVLKRQQSFMAMQAANRLLHRLLSAAFRAWQEKAHLLARVRELMSIAVGKRTVELFHRWTFYAMDCKDARDFIATKVGAIWRGVAVRWTQKQLKSAVLIQSLYRSRKARKLANRLMMAKMNRDEKVAFYARRIVMRSVVAALNAWKRYVRKMRRVKRMCNKALGNGLRARLVSWRLWLKAAKNARLFVANAMYRVYSSRRFRIHVARLVTRTAAVVKIQAFLRATRAKRLVLYMMRRRRAATNIQRVYRGYAGRVEAAWQKYYNACALMVQRVWRGYLARKAVRFMQIDMVLNYAKTKHYEGMVWAFDNGWGYVHDELGNCALHYSAMYGSRRILKLCLRKEIDANIPNLAGESPLIAMCSRRPYPKQLELIEYLAWHGGDMEAIDNTGGTAIFAAARVGRTDIIELLVNLEADANHADHTGRTALHVAAAAGHLAAVQKLLSFDVFFGGVDHSGATPLHDAAAGGHAEVMHHLLFVGADPSAQECDGYTPLHYAINARQLPAAAFLLQWGADPNVPDYRGRSPLHICADVGDDETALLLAEGDADVDCVDEDGDTPLHCAVRGNHVATAKVLLGHGAVHGIVNLNGDAPIHLACAAGHTEMTQLLISYDPEMNLKNFEGRTPLGEARMNKHDHIIDLIHRKYVFVEVAQYGTLVAADGTIKTFDVAEEETWNTGGWVEKLDLDTGSPYWVNLGSGETVYDKPSELGGDWIMQYHAETQSFYWENAATGARRDVDPEAAGTKRRVLRRRISVQKGKGGLSVVDYKLEWQQMQDEIAQDKREARAAALMQKIVRGRRARRLVRELIHQHKMAVPIQSVARGWMARRQVQHIRYLYNAARNIQRVYRGHVGRMWYRYHLHEHRVQKGAADINRVYRGFRARRRKRRLWWKKNGPFSPPQWDALRYKAKSYKKRSWRGWDEYHVAATPDIHFYFQPSTGTYQWDQPAEWLHLERLEVKSADEMRRWGFSTKQWEAAMFLQSAWRGRNARIYYNKMKKAIVMMKEAEERYLNNPEHVPFRMNYTLYLHAVAHDYDRCRTMYLSLMEYMNQRGPDNAVVLYSFALYLSATCEEDFVLVETLLERARAVDPKGNKFDMAEHGFFRQAVIENPKDAHALFNWALVLQFLHNNFTEAEQYYIRALDAAPSDRRIVDNYNYLLSTYMDVDYDAYEAFRRLQEERGMVAVLEAAEETTHKAQHEAAFEVQRVWRGYRVRDMIVTLATHVHEVKNRLEEHVSEDGTTYYYDPVTSQSMYEQPTVFASYMKLRKLGVVTGNGTVTGGGVELGGVWRGDHLTAQGEEAVALIAGAEGTEENPDDWEFARSETLEEYYYNLHTGETRWTAPKFAKPPIMLRNLGAITRKHAEAFAHSELLVGGAADWEYVETPESVGEDGKVVPASGYWCNNLTGDTSWEKPQCVADAEAPPPEEPAEVDYWALWEAGESDWEPAYDEEGNVYYYSHTTGHTTWDPPDLSQL